MSKRKPSRNVTLPGSIDPATQLAQLARRRHELDQDERRAVGHARAAGLSWERIGAALKVTGETCRRRYG